ncbi:unnamed protein product [Blepharisma stoltei]|uniref:Ubiquitin-like domain-containing protein n=1 Tax=Blepharisma stoltei TaxID=1481888 RepID=A0AAU9JXZ6_9CILI|nr:unnamed protein product [Blepharisma stoltei]
MEFISDLAYPTFVLAILGILGYKAYSSTPQGQNSHNNPAPQQEDITVRIYSQNRIFDLNINTGVTGSELSQRIFTPTELANHQPVLIFMGRRLELSSPLYLQGVRNGSAIHTQLSERQNENSERSGEGSHFLITLFICGASLLILWYFFYQYPQYYSNLSKLMLLGFTLGWSGVALSYFKPRNQP